MHCAALHLRVATNSFHIVLYCCTSFIISYMRKTCCFLDALSKTFQTETFALPSCEKKSNWPQLPNRILAVGFSRFSGNGDHCLSVLAKVWKRRSWLGCYCTLDWKYTQKYLDFFLEATQYPSLQIIGKTRKRGKWVLGRHQWLMKWISVGTRQIFL